MIIAKLDRLSRNVAFLANMMESDVEFLVVDTPHSDKFMIHILAAAAQFEAEMISKRTREALAAAKARGVKLGNPYGFSRMKRNEDISFALHKRIENADRYAKDVYPIIKGLMDEGFSLNAIAKRMMEMKELTPRGGSKWSPTQVENILKRVK